MNALTPLAVPVDRLPGAASRAPGQAETLDLRALRYAAAAARHGNLAAAAREQGVTAAAISQQIRKLEQELGVALLLRHGRGVTPTPAGTALLHRVDAIQRLLAAPLDPTDEPVAPEGAVSVALPAELAPILAGPLASRLRRAMSAIRLTLREFPGGDAEAWLLDGRVDIAVLQDPGDIDALEIDRVAVEALGIVAAPRDALGRNSLPLRLRDLTGVTLILPNQRHWIRRMLTKAAFQRGVALDVAIQADGAAMVRDMVRTGLGCAVLPAAAVREDTSRGALVFRPLEQPALATTHAVAIRRDASPGVRAIAAATAQAIRALAATEAWLGSAVVPPLPAVAATGVDAATEAAWRLPRPDSLMTALERAEGG